MKESEKLIVPPSRGATAETGKVKSGNAVAKSKRMMKNSKYDV